MPDTLSVMGTGAYSKVNAFTRKDVYVYAGMSNLFKGTYQLPVFIGNNSRLSYDLITP